MILEEIGVYPVLFSEAAHLAFVDLGQCELYIPCKTREEAKRIQAIVEAHLRTIDNDLHSA